MNRGSSKVDIPIEAIVQEYAAYAMEIVEAVSKELVKETRRQAKRAFVSQTGRLYKSIKKRKSKFDKDTVIVGAFAPHAQLVEFGTGMRVDKRGKTSGHVPAKPFLSAAEAAVRDRLKQIAESVVAPTVKVGK